MNESPIIEQPSLKSPLRKGSELTITAVAWLLWFYLAMPLLTLLLWAVGLRLVFLEHFRFEHARALLDVAGYYLVGAVVLWVLIEAWSVYNRARFGGDDRRKHADPATDDELAATFSLAPSEIERAREAKILTVHFEADNIVRLEANEFGGAAS